MRSQPVKPGAGAEGEKVLNNKIFPLMNVDGPPAVGGQATHKDYLLQNKNFPLYWATPILESIYEAVLMFRGERVVHGGMGDSQVPYGVADGNYISPINQPGQENHIVLLTDGQSHSLKGAQWRIKSLIKQNCAATSKGVDEDCGLELARYLNQHDQSSTIEGKQTITLHTIGFNFSNKFIKDLAKAGGGEFYKATNVDDLNFIFEGIVGNIEAATDVVTNSTFASAPAISVNSFSRFSHNQDIYFTLFQPEATPYWAGNLKLGPAYLSSMCLLTVK